MILADMRLRSQPFQRNGLGKVFVDQLLDFSAVQRSRQRRAAGNLHLHATADFGKKNVQDIQQKCIV